MGDIFVEGVGDEVVLFVSFLILSLSFLTVAALWRRQRREPEHATRTRTEGTPSRSQQVPDCNQAGRETSNGGHAQNTTESDGLRHRFAADSSRSAESPSRTDMLEHVETEEVGVPGGRVLEDAEMTLRLVRAGMAGHPMEVCVTPSCTIDYLRQTYFHVEVSRRCPVRFIYQGRVIGDDNTTIGNLDIQDGGAMHVHVGRPLPQGEAPRLPPPQDIDLSHIFLPLLGVILGIVWVGMLSFPYVFTFLTKLFLFALSFGYIVLAYYSTQA